MKIGFIGLGRMGAAMAKRFPVCVPPFFDGTAIA